MKDHVVIEIPRKSDFLSLVRLTASGIANLMGFSFEEIEDIRIAVAEAVLNSFLNDSEKESIKIEFFFDEEELNIQICSFNPNFVAVEEDEERGLGIIIIESLMDSVEFREDCVVMSKFVGE